MGYDLNTAPTAAESGKPLAASAVAASRPAPVWTNWSTWFFDPAEGSMSTLPARVHAANVLAALLMIGLVIYLPFTVITTPWNWRGVYQYRAKFIQGYEVTIVLSLMALVLSTVIGLCSALASSTRFLPLRYVNRIYIDLVRGTPLLVQILILYYVTANALGIDNRIFAGALILSISYGAYISEVIRGGIESVGKSQLESAKAIGLNRAQTYRYVIFPQALRQMMPSLAGQFVSLIKDTSLLSVISVGEFTLNAQETSNITFSSLACYIPLAVGYLILTIPITQLTRYLEKRNRYET